jgi:hypothetical protein
MKSSPRTTKLILFSGILFLIMLLSSLIQRNTFFEGMVKRKRPNITPQQMCEMSVGVKRWDSTLKKCVDLATGIAH